MINNLLQTARKEHAEALKAGVEDRAQYLTLFVSGEMYAIAILHVKEIIEYGAITTVPMMPNFIRGVINLRGAVVPVVDLANRFGDKPSKITRRSCIVIVEVAVDDESLDIGVIVDSVSAVLDIPTSETEPPPAFGARIRPDFIEGMGKVDGRFVIILKIGSVLSVDELAELGSTKAR